MSHALLLLLIHYEFIYDKSNMGLRET